MGYGTNFITGGTASADAYYNASYSPDKAVDGNITTAWGTADGAPHWWKYDLGAGVAKKAAKLRIYTISPFGFNSFTLQGSNDDSGYTTILTNNLANSTGWQEFTFSNSVAYRYYKINALTDYVGAVNTYEIEMMETIAGNVFGIIIC